MMKFVILKKEHVVTPGKCGGGKLVGRWKPVKVVSQIPENSWYEFVGNEMGPGEYRVNAAVGGRGCGFQPIWQGEVGWLS